MTDNNTAPSEDQPTTSGQESLEESIRLRAHQISQSNESGTPEENWARAERELKSQDKA